MRERVIVKYKKFDDKKDIYVPEYKTNGSSGMDLMSIEELVLSTMGTITVPTNLSVEIPDGYEIQIRSRSGLAVKHGVIVLNSPGTIDSDYRGEIKVILHNTGFEDFDVNIGDRIAQMVLAKVEKMELYEDKLSKTNRNSGGFGSTGTN
jgi:dUTP pyrophosphatase